MVSPKMTRAEMIKWLGDAISAETEKPFDKIDYDFIDACGQLLDKLMGKSAAVSDDEIAKEMTKLIPNTTTRVQKGFGQKRLWRIAIIAAVVLCMSITVLAIPQLRAMLLNALQLDIGETVEDGGIVYVNYGKSKIYATMQELIKTENLNILCFEDSTDVLSVTSIDHMEEISATMVSFNDPTIVFKISHDVNLVDDAIKENPDEYITNNITAYLFQKDTFEKTEYSAYIYYGNDTYTINCTSKETLLSVLNALKKGE